MSIKIYVIMNTNLPNLGLINMTGLPLAALHISSNSVTHSPFTVFCGAIMISTSSSSAT
jgi:hypothetical protein